jgi:signal transduction histidine kinase
VILAPYFGGPVAPYSGRCASDGRAHIVVVMLETVIPAIAVLTVVAAAGSVVQGWPLAASGLVATAGVGILVAVLHRPGYSLVASEIFFEAALVGVPLAVGAAMRRRRDLRRRLGERAEALARERGDRARAVLDGERRDLAARLDAALLGDVEALERATGTEPAGPLAEIEEISRRALDRLRQTLTMLHAEAISAAAVEPQAPAGQRAVPRGLWAGAACLIAAALEIESLTSHVARGPVLAHVAVGCCLAVALALLPVRPLPAAAGCFALAYLQSRLLTPLAPLFTPNALLIIAPYLVARRSGRTAAITGLLVCAAGAASVLRAGPVTSSNDLPLSVVLICAAWIAGRFLRRQAELIEQLAARTSALAAEQRLRAVRIRAAERERVARDVHDAIGHTLTIATLHTAAARRCADTDHARSAEHLRVVRSSARQVRADLRRMLSGDQNEADQDLSGLMERLVTGARVAGLTVDLRADGIAEVTGEAATAAYRVV